MLTIIAASIVACSTGRAARKRSDDPSPVVANVDGENITVAQLEGFYALFMRRSGLPMDEAKKQEAVLSSYIDMLLLAREVPASRSREATTIDLYVDEAISRYRKMRLREVSISIPDADIDNHYQKTIGKHNKPAQFKLTAVTFEKNSSSESQAREAWAELQGKCSKIQKYSDRCFQDGLIRISDREGNAVISRRYGAEIPFMSADSLGTEFGDALKDSLPTPCRVTGTPIKVASQERWVMYLVTACKEPREQALDDRLKEEIRRDLEWRRHEAAEAKYIADLRLKAKIIVHDKELRRLRLERDRRSPP